ncbi:MAG: cobyrinic acid ac-diamide synthase [Burkholderiaceae bacterium]|nr:cobyrinic acid ac-diamide synthase [Burkholderiaceae bacterium]
MIVAIAGQSSGPAKAVVANYLALLRARSGRKVMLLDADPQRAACAWCQAHIAAGRRPRVDARAISGATLAPMLESLRLRYNDIVIDTEGRDTPDSRAALSAARLVLVPVALDQVDLDSQYQLIARLNVARMFNPTLRVLFVILGQSGEPSVDEIAAVRSYVTRVMSATLAGTVLHYPCAPDEMDALYREVFAH